MLAKTLAHDGNEHIQNRDLRQECWHCEAHCHEKFLFDVFIIEIDSFQVAQY